MKLNNDCVRDCLLFLEEQPDRFKDYVSNVSIKDYSHDELAYTFAKLLDAEYINAGDASTYEGRDLIIGELTWTGHQFLDNIRDNIVWKKTKEVSKKFSSVSISILTDVAANIIKNMITQQ